MASFEFDNVKAEKEDALWRYNMERKLRMGLRLCGFCLALFLLLWSWFPTLIPDTVEVAGDYGRCFVSTFNKPLFTFILVNIIILAVYILSSQKQSQKQTSCPDLYDEYVGSRRSNPTSVVAAAYNSPVAEETMVDKKIILVENALALSPVKQQPTTVDTVTETKRSPSPAKQTTMIRTAVKKTKPAVSATPEAKTKEYRRTRSMVSESRNQLPREFLRSDTAIGRELVVSGGDPPRKSMDEMSSEEFQSIVDSFIAERKRTLLQENTAHYTRRKDKCMSIVVKN
ncbi:uncharacterized protein LOC110417329 [Herrania umbratica]|uniref:Uncharacterized protein LOC110417329 n=1 Tax=Herrania umbratica TaxID=108875 RepID=A0A6J1AED2_9ROSI|nr:uncharacterized protein LOC110417329 [Herrania umbratica]